MTYREYRDKRQKEINALPLFWAFSDEQFKTEMEKRGLTENDTDKVVRVAGGLCLKKDVEKVIEFFKKPDELPELMKDETFAKEAFRYEMDNHEYAINWQGDWDVCSCFGKCEYDESKNYVDYLKELGYEQNIIGCYAAARREHYAVSEEW